MLIDDMHIHGWALFSLNVFSGPPPTVPSDSNHFLFKSCAACPFCFSGYHLQKLSLL